MIMLMHGFLANLVGTHPEYCVPLARPGPSRWISKSSSWLSNSFLGLGYRSTIRRDTLTRYYWGQRCDHYRRTKWVSADREPPLYLPLQTLGLCCIPGRASESLLCLKSKPSDGNSNICPSMTNGRRLSELQQATSQRLSPIIQR